MNTILYKIINNVNGKFYVGKHRQQGIDFDGYLGSGKVIKEAIKKYGRNNFSRQTIVLSTEEYISELEERYIERYNLREDVNCYNIGRGGTGGEVEKHTKETKKKMSIKSKGKNNPMYGIHRAGKDNPNFGTRWDNQQRYNMSENCKKRFSNPINHPMYGKKHTQEAKDKQSKSKIGKSWGNHSEETKIRIGELHRGKVYSEETRRKIGLGKEIPVIIDNIYYNSKKIAMKLLDIKSYYQLGLIAKRMK